MGSCFEHNLETAVVDSDGSVFHGDMRGQWQGIEIGQRNAIIPRPFSSFIFLTFNNFHES